LSYHRSLSRHLPVALAFAAMAACAPVTAPAPGPTPEVTAGIPPIPRVDGPLQIRVVHPTPSMARPNVDSTLIYGSVGTGNARLTINGIPVTVEPNGAFLGFLPTPPDGTYNLAAEAGGRTVTATASYRAPAAAVTPTPAVTLVEFAQPRTATITGGGDTLQTGSDVAIGRTTPTGNFRWFLPRGARLTATGQQGQMVRVTLGQETAWFPAADVTLAETTAPATRAALAAPRVIPAGEWIDVRIPAGGAPFLLQPEGERIVLTIYGRTPPAGEQPSNDPLMAPLTWRDTGAAQAEIRLNRPLWGYKAFYTPEGDLVVRVRRPPNINADRPLNGIRVLVDPGHPPAGATGPTGLTEAEANLSISLRLAEMLRARGAEVIMTRTTAAPLVSATDQAAELRARTRLAVDSDVHLFVSVHNNAFPEGVNPWRSHGTSTYHFHPFAAQFARVLNEEIVGTTRIRDLGHRSGNLAVVRPTWFPAALTESVFMPIPEQEAALRNPAFVERLAAAHMIGIERFLRSQAR
jgi:N-acetylmuramoyl-L-alanine amidase